MAYTRGGRGLKAPYETTHMRIPVPLKERIQAIVEEYKKTLDNQVDPETDDVLTPSEAEDFARHILAYKKSSRISMQKLLTGIYKRDFVL